MTALSAIEGIGDAFAVKLKAAGVGSVEALLVKGGKRKDRKALADQTGIGDALILKWVNRADLFRVKGVGEEYSDLLEKAGVDTVAELAKRKAANLHPALLKINAEKGLVRRPPALSEVEGWIEFAKSLPRAVEY